MQGTPYGCSAFPRWCPPWPALHQAALGYAAGGRDCHREVKWEVPLGTIRDLAPLPLPITWGTPNLGGPIVTKGGVVFIGAAMDNYLRAFDLESGKELWKGRLPAGGQATPMSYRLDEGGRQFVVIAAGGHGSIGTDIGDSVVAFALPESGAGLLAQSMAPTLPNGRGFDHRFLGRVAHRQIRPQELALVSAGGHPYHHRDVHCVAGKPEPPRELPYPRRGRGNCLAVDLGTQTPACTLDK
jgi:hypothetical protein